MQEDKFESIPKRPFSVESAATLRTLELQATQGGYVSKSEIKMGGKYWEKRTWIDMTNRYVERLILDYPEHEKAIETIKREIALLTQAKEQKNEFLSFDESLKIDYQILLSTLKQKDYSHTGEDDYKKRSRKELQDLIDGLMRTLRESFPDQSESDFVKASQVFQTINDAAASLHIFLD